ncbi:FadR/GntR family transcriptional regulator [Nocardiopsis coralliicola]
METTGPDGALIRPVVRTRIHEEVARQLRDLMRQGSLRPGDRLPPERELASRFAVSRPTIRQALSMLQSQGLVESRPGAGTFARSATPVVTELTAALGMVDASLGDQLELRRLIEPEVARGAAERVSGGELAELHAHIGAQERSMASGVPFVAEDSAFHLAIARMTENALLATVVEGIHELLSGSREFSLRAPGGMQRSLEGHRRILAALESGDPMAAHRAMLDHILDVERLSLQAVSAGESGAAAAADGAAGQGP